MIKKKSTAIIVALALVIGSLCGCDTTVNLNSDSSSANMQQDVEESAEITQETAEELSDDSENKQSESDSNYEMTSDSVHVYYEGSYGSEEEDITMYFRNGNRQVAYYDIDTVCHVMEKLYNGGYGDYEKDPDYKLSVKADGNKVTFERENGYDMNLDFDKNTISFHDYDMFISHSYDMTTVDLSHSSGFDSEGNPIYLERVEEKSCERYGIEYMIDLGEYNIELIADGEGYYVPAQTMADLLIGSTYTRYLYNGVNAFYINYDNFDKDIYSGTGVASLFYMTDRQERSQELIDFTYNELCMALDNGYGLKGIHNIDSFDMYFQELGVDGKSLKQMLCSDNPVEMEKAIRYLVQRGFDDLHSSYSYPGPYAGIESLQEVYEIQNGPSYTHFADIQSKYNFERMFSIADENRKVPGYQEIGNTAYVTFDKFISAQEDYYANPPKEAPEDTVGLLIYAHSMITREGSPIENIVMDLSCNTGGAEDAVAFVCAWFLKDAMIFLQNSLTGASSTNVYRCDVNLDHKFDENDCVSNYNLYCLISPVSFSCGNLAPCVFDCSHKVTMIGQNSGGGACVVLPMTTASGSVFQVSGYRVISSMKNGSFYDCDLGVVPTIPLTKVKSFYDREALTEYINGLK